MTILEDAVLLILGFVVGMLVGRKNPSIAAAAVTLAKKGDAQLQAAIAAAKAKLAAGSTK